MDLNQIKPYFSEQWWDFLCPILEHKKFAELMAKVAALYKKGGTTPSPVNLFKAFKVTNFDALKVVIIGQDPYYQAGVADGLAFSTRALSRPESLKNIFLEIRKDYFQGEVIKNSQLFYGNDLEQWSRQGVLLLNRCLTTQINTPGAHHEIGWDWFTASVVNRLEAYPHKLLYLLWGNYAKQFKVIIKEHEMLEAGHPSPRSYKHFKGCQHFTQANLFIKDNNKHRPKEGRLQINWGLWDIYLDGYEIKSGENVERMTHLEDTYFKRIDENGFKVFHGKKPSELPLKEWCTKLNKKPINPNYDYLKPKVISKKIKSIMSWNDNHIKVVRICQ